MNATGPGQRFEGRALHRSLPHGRSPCLLVFNSSRLDVELPDGRVLFVELVMTSFCRQGVSGQEWVLIGQGPDAPTVSSTDPNWPIALESFAPPPLKAQILADRRRRRRDRWTKWLVAPAVLALLLGVLPWLALDGLTELAAQHLPPEVDKELGDLALPSCTRDLGAEARPSTEPVAQAALATVLERLAQARPKEPRPRLHLYQSPVVNAFALPGGHVVLTTALLRSFRSADEAAAVLAHEWAHVRHRHGVRSLVRRAGVFLVLAAVLGDDGTLTALVLQGAGELAGLDHSRELEAEADADAVGHLQAAGLDGLALDRALQAIETAGEKGSDLPGFLRSHPTTPERLQAIRALARKEPAAGPAFQVQPLAVDWPAVKAKLLAQDSETAP